ncbi:MAG: c-type cytochrome domain-containing protein [Bryobacteraceae bacterium]
MNVAQRSTRTFAILLLAAGQILLADVKTPAKSKVTPEVAFTKTVQPFLSANCVGCHNAKVKTANLDLQQFTSVDAVRANLKVWKKVAWKIEAGDMPPAKFPRPKPAAQRATLKWINAELAAAK